MKPIDVVVLGAGAAGLLAAARCAERGRRTVLLEKNRKPGVKILISGGTRCNVTHDADREGVMEAFGRNGRFLRTALTAFGPDDLVRLLNAEGVATKVESTGKVFPVSDRALDVQQALLRRLGRSGCDLRLGAPAVEVERGSRGFRVRAADGEFLAEKLILATGGRSYPGCGTVGDGYAWLERLGHSVVPTRPALVPIASDAGWVHALRGLALADVLVRVVPRSLLEQNDDWAREALFRRRRLDERRGDLLFTHFGLSGPAVLDVSRTVTAHAEPRDLAVAIDLAPDRGVEAVDEDLRSAFLEHGGRSASRILAEWIPQRLAETVLRLCGLDPKLRAAEASRPARRKLAAAMKTLSVPVTGTLGFAKAEVTAGGAALSEIDPRSMESKIAPGLFVVGEILDLDGWIGGYNFQSAFSTGWLAAESV